MSFIVPDFSYKPPAASLVFDFKITDKMQATVMDMYTTMDADRLREVAVHVVVTERLGGYLVEPGGIVCADWDGVLAAVRRAWGVA